MCGSKCQSPATCTQRVRHPTAVLVRDQSVCGALPHVQPPTHVFDRCFDRWTPGYKHVPQLQESLGMQFFFLPSQGRAPDVESYSNIGMIFHDVATADRGPVQQLDNIL